MRVCEDCGKEERNHWPEGDASIAENSQDCHLLHCVFLFENYLACRLIGARHVIRDIEAQGAPRLHNNLTTVPNHSGTILVCRSTVIYQYYLQRNRRANKAISVTVVMSESKAAEDYKVFESLRNRFSDANSNPSPSRSEPRKAGKRRFDPRANAPPLVPLVEEGDQPQV